MNRNLLAGAPMNVQFQSDNILSDKAACKVANWVNNYHQDIDRPSWDSYFISLAHQVKLRSLDSQTKCGCVLVRQDNTPLGFGYNSPVRGVDDNLIPNVRPAKYIFYIHSELNALLNCLRNGISTLNAKAYVTGLPCPHCLQSMYQSGITEVIYDTSETSSKPHMVDNAETELFYEIFLYLTKGKFIVREYQNTNEVS